MSKTTKKDIQKTRKKRKSPVVASSNVIIVTHTTEKETLFPEKLKKMNKMLSKAQFLKIIVMAEVTNIGLDVFGSMEKFKLWLSTPNLALGKLKPIELLKDSHGKEMVIGELTRINYGILA